MTRLASLRDSSVPRSPNSAAAAPHASQCCLICGSDAGDALFTGTEERFGLGGRFPVLSCRECGFGWTSLGQDFDLNHWYEQAYWQDGGNTTRLSNGAPAGRYRTLRDAWRLINGSARPSRWVRTGRVLDVGCGPGYDTLEMQELGARVAGIDRSLAALGRASCSGIPVVRASPPAYPFAEASFDTVVMSQILEHLPDPDGALAGAHRLLRPHGRLLVVVPNAAGTQRRVFGRHWVNWHLPYHLWHFDGAAIRTLIARCGFRIERLRTCSPGEWLLLSLGLRWPSLRRAVANRALSRSLRLIAAPALRIADALGRGDCLVVEAYKA